MQILNSMFAALGAAIGKAVSAYKDYCARANKEARERARLQAMGNLTASHWPDYLHIADLLHSAISTTATITHLVVPNCSRELLLADGVRWCAGGFVGFRYRALRNEDFRKVPAETIERVLTDELQRVLGLCNLPPMVIHAAFKKDNVAFLTAALESDVLEVIDQKKAAKE